MLEALTGWLLNYLLHSTVLLGGVWALERLGVLRHPAWREAFWRWAFFGAVVTASLQPLLQHSRVELRGAWEVPTGAVLADAGSDADANASAGNDASTATRDTDLDGAAATPHAAPAGALRSSPDGVATHRPAARSARADADVATSVEPAPQPVLIVSDGAASDEHAASEGPAPHPHDDLRIAAAALVLAWPIVAALGLALTLVRWLRLRRQVRMLPLEDDAELRNAAAALASRAGVPRPTLRISAGWPSPLVAPGAQICLPLRLMRSLDAGQRVAVLAHEIAHLGRRDLHWRLAARLVAQLGWLQPLNRLALRRLDLLAELACDAWAAAEAGPVPLAESLYVCARDRAAPPSGPRAWLRSGAMPALASAMAAARSPLMQRMHALLEDAPMSDTPTSARRRVGRWLLAAGLCGMALAVPMIVIGKAPRINVDIDDMRGVVSRLVGGSKYTRQVSISPGHELRISYNGELVFNDEESDVLFVEGKLRIDERLGGVSRRVEITPDSHGGTTRRYWVDDVSRPIDDEARRWIGEQLAMVAESVHGSEPRARRLLARGGVDAVLADVAKAPDPFVRRSRIEGLLATGPQAEDTLTRLIALTAEMGDDFQRRTALQALIERQPLTPLQQQAVLKAVDSLNGAFERREVLVALSPGLSEDAAVLAAWRQAVKGIDSDFDKRTALVALLESGSDPARPARLNAVLDASLMVSGDFDRRTVLEAVSQRLHGSAAADLPAQAARYAEVVRAMASDFERRTALVSLLDEVTVDREVATQVLRAMDGMDSGFDRAELLVALAGRMPADAGLIAQFRLTARGLSPHDRGRVEEALDHLSPA